MSAWGDSEIRANEGGAPTPSSPMSFTIVAMTAAGARPRRFVRLHWRPVGSRALRADLCVACGLAGASGTAFVLVRSLLRGVGVRASVCGDCRRNRRRVGLVRAVVAVIASSFAFALFAALASLMPLGETLVTLALLFVGLATMTFSHVASTPLFRGARAWVEFDGDVVVEVRALRPSREHAG